MEKHALANGWEVSLIELSENGTKRYKVTRRLPDMKVSITKTFSNLIEAKEQFEKWLQ